jgi:hypothetical protein
VAGWGDRGLVAEVWCEVQGRRKQNGTQEAHGGHTTNAATLMWRSTCTGQAGRRARQAIRGIKLCIRSTLNTRGMGR